MRESEDLKIGPNTYQVKHLKAKYQRRVLRRIMAAMAPLAMAETLAPEELIRKVVDALTDEDLDTITACFAAETKVCTPAQDGVFLPLEGDFLEEHFAGPNMGLWLQWVKKSIDYNFASFFAELRTLMVQVVRAAEPKVSE